MASGFFQDIKRYVGFTHADSERLASFSALAEPEFRRIAELFYERMHDHPEALAVFEDNAQVERLKDTLVVWMRSGLSGPHDESFFERRLRIGAAHVRIALPQQYMATAMNVIRLELDRLVDASDQPRAELRASVHRWLDLELAIMFQSYKAHSDSVLSRRERLAGVGHVAGTIAHELRNPLGVIESSLYLIRTHIDAPDPAVERHLERISQQVQMASGIITDLLEMVRDRKPSMNRFSVRPLFERVIEQVQRPLAVELAIRDDSNLSLRGDESLVERALVNLVTNAVQALGAGPGRISLIAEPAGTEVRITVVDSGPGFDPEILPTVFQPLVTGRKEHGGVGLGLALVQRIAQSHGGRAKADNPPTGGARVALVFPA